MTLALSLTFAEDPQSSIHTAFSQASVSCVLPLRHSDITGSSDPEGILGGAVVGCEDGTLYLFHAAKSARESLVDGNTSAKGSSNVPSSSRSSTSPPPHRPRRNHRSSRSLSPASAKSPPFSPFQVTKSTVVSSVSAEQVEAPKNYVDFEDEQAKLKGMLKNKGGVKERTMADALMLGNDKLKPLGPDKCTDDESKGDSGIRGPTKTELRISTSTARSSSSSVTSLSTPTTPLRPQALRLPGSEHSSSWDLISHTIPTQATPTGSVSAIRVVPGCLLTLALFHSGAICLFSTEDGTCVQTSAVEGGMLSGPPGSKARSKLPVIWHWKNLHIVRVNQSFLILACGTSEATTSAIQPHELENGERNEETRVVAFELVIERRDDPDAVELTKVGDWSLDGPADGIAVHTSEDGQLTLLHVNSLHHVVRQRLTLLDGPPTPDGALEASSSNTHLPLPNPFKAALMGLRSSDNLAQETKADDTDRILLTHTLDVGVLPLNSTVKALRLLDAPSPGLALAWSNEQLCVFDIGGDALRAIGSTPVRDVRDVKWAGNDALSIAFSDRLEIRDLVTVDANNDEPPPEGATTVPTTIDLRVRRSCAFTAAKQCILTEAGEVLATRPKNGRQRLQLTTMAPERGTAGSATESRTRLVWKPRKDAVAKTLSTPRITSMLPVDLDHVVVGYSDGYLAQCSLVQLAQGFVRPPSGHVSDIPLAGSITSMQVVRDERSGQNVIVGGADDGSVAIWSLGLRLLARWIVFTEPLTDVISLPPGRLKECIICISRDGTLALIALDGYQLLFLVPASVAPLRKVCVGEDNLLLLYADNRARLWDTKTREFWRSTNADKVDEMLKQGGWTEWSIPRTPTDAPTVITALSGKERCPDAAASLVLDVEALLLHLATLAYAKAGDIPTSAVSSIKRDYLRAALSILLSFGTSEEIDRICRDGLKILPSNAAVGLSRHGALTTFPSYRGNHAWTTSPVVSAARSVGIASLLQVLTQHNDDAHTVLAFYAASLTHSVGPSYQAPNLAYLARLCLHSSVTDVRNAARMCFDAEIARLGDEEVAGVVDNWQSYLPYLQTEAQKESVRSALSLFICGTIAVEKYTLLHTTSLTDLAKSIALYLHDERCPYRALAIDLCSRGFPVWQQYVDAVEMLRALFALATAGRKDSAPHQPAVGQQARSAVLNIAEGNTPLFMTTVSMDILHPKSVQHRKSVMQLVIFLIHKKPLALYSNLPRLVEAVVKSLDPNSTADRDAVLDSATEILGHIVDSYPTVDFHGPSQRLAVGSSEGAVVMYDLKTATRLYVLEGHKKRTTACAFSPDGRRLVTLSLEECSVLVWKVGSSFTSFFMPGAPPRQGHSGSDPFKTYPFNIGEDGVMQIKDTLELIHFEWAGDRSVRVKIRGVTLTFST